MSKVTRVSTDVGGTFTDLVYFEIDTETGAQTVRTAKSDTTPPDFERGILEVLRKGQVDVKTLGAFSHGTTVVINALTERRGAQTALITTTGFRDTLEIARGARPDFFNLKYVKPAPFVARHRRRELPGRMNAQGEEIVPLDLASLPAILASFREEGIEAIAVSFLHAYANPQHEERTVAAIKRLWPEVAVVGSHQITREWREYERTNTAVLSAYVQPIADCYLSRLSTQLSESGYTGPIYVMQSNCGVDTLEHARTAPITMVESGPASGMWGAAALGGMIGEPNVIALDIGGTTAKCSLIKDGRVQIKTDYYIEKDRQSTGYPIMVPVVDLVEIGNGGGSIAWLDEFKRLHVGPKSAGASPGPAAYGRGGQSATTTDANLKLGRINPDYFCGGELTADMDAVERSLAPLAESLGISNEEVAVGIIDIANFNMVNALKLISINRGFDPRDFTLIAFGGGGAMHAVALALELGVKKVVIPRGAGVFSAWGMMMSDLRRDQFLTRLTPFTDREAAAEVQSLIHELVGKAVAEYAQDDIPAKDVSMVIGLRLRYQNQEHAVEVEMLEDERCDVHLADIVERFHASYERQYTYRLEAPVELIGLHVVAFAKVGKLDIKSAARGTTDAGVAVKGQRAVNYAADGVHSAIIYDSLRLAPGMRFAGPAVIEDPGTTILVFPHNAVEVDEFSNICITSIGADHA